jgi:tryptophanyl-tRNA synthetase
MKQRLLSGIQPSGELHLGNYLGAVKQWISLQNDYDSLFSIVDLHAITVRQNPQELRDNVRLAAATYLASGVDPAQAAIFVQSHVSAHAELAWVLNTFAQMGELERMTQFKDKSARNAKNINAGLFTYPVLMAADILLYDTAVVPVGDDQKQHIELARTIAQRVNNHYDTEIFVVPEGKFMESGARIMGLDNPENKMSKSASSALNYISLLDEPDVARKKIMKAVTDTGSEVRAADDKPGVTNLLTIYSLLTDRPVEDIEKEYAGHGYGGFKKGLAEVVIGWLTPLQARIQELLADKAALDTVLTDGAQKADAIAQTTLDRVYTAVGLR